MILQPLLSHSRDFLILPQSLTLSSSPSVCSVITVAIGVPLEVFVHLGYVVPHFIVTVTLYFAIFVSRKSLYFFYVLCLAVLFLMRIIVFFLHY